MLGCRSSDTLLHIFTSGTTGLPKAARLNHIRFFSAIVLPHLFDLTAADRFFTCLPMCHTAAVGALSMCWWLGIPLVLAPLIVAPVLTTERLQTINVLSATFPNPARGGAVAQSHFKIDRVDHVNSTCAASLFS